MKTIHKYEIPLQGGIDIPKGADILSVGNQGGGLYLWALIEPSTSLEHRDIIVVGTGHPFNHPTTVFIGTVHFPAVNLVWHIFEVV